MEMMNGLASCLIKVRQHHIGFPSLFSHYPDGMKREELVEIHEYVQNAMDQTRDIPEASGYIRRVVIGTGKYLILGVSGYAQHLAAEVRNIPYELVDFTGRGCPGFIGFVWDLEKTPMPSIGFPSLSTFGAVFRELILEHWEDSKNSAWAYQTREGVKVPYQYPISLDPFDAISESVILNHNKKKICSFDRSKEDGLLHQAVLEASQKQVTSICTDLYLNSEEGSSFLNMTADQKGGPVETVENAKTARIKPAAKPSNEAGNKQEREPPEISRNPVDLNDDPAKDDKAENGQRGIMATLRGMIPPKEEPRTVYVKLTYTPCQKTRELSSQFVDQLAATYRNKGLEIEYDEVFYQPSKKLIEIYILAVHFPTSISLDDFIMVCRGILSYYYRKKWVCKKPNGQCVVKGPDGRKDFRMFVSYNHVPATAILRGSEEILLDTSKPETKKPEPSQAGAHRKSEEQSKQVNPQTNNDPLIQRIKQTNTSQPGKKDNATEDPFKCFD